MKADARAIAASFDTRAATCGQREWHRRCAERLVALCPLRSGSRVLDAGTGTGFAALAAARLVGRQGLVCGVDLSAGMLREARAALRESGLTNVEILEADADRARRREDTFWSQLEDTVRGTVVEPSMVLVVRLLLSGTCVLALMASFRHILRRGRV